MPGRSRRTATALAACALVLGLDGAEAQERTPASVGVISGRVVDAATGAALSDADVVLEPHPAGTLEPGGGGGAFLAGSRRTRTDEEGEYRFARAVRGEYRLHVHRIGYEGATIVVEFRGATDPRVGVGLSVRPIPLEPITVAGAPSRTPAATYGRGVDADPDTLAARRVAVERLRQRRHLLSDVRAVTHADVEEALSLGETDLFRALQRLPGVGRPDEYSAEMWTRGATWDQTRVYFDGLPLFNPLHGLGLLSGVNADALGAAFLHPGVQPAGLGGGGAAVLDLRSRRGGAESGPSNLAELSLLSGRLATDGRTAGGRWRYMIAARRSYLDWATRAIGAIAGDSTIHVPYSLMDVAFRNDVDLGKGRSIEWSGLVQEDRLDGTVPDLVEGTRGSWGGAASRITWAAPLGPLDTRTTVGFSGYDSRLESLTLPPEQWNDPRLGEPSDNELRHYTVEGEVAPRDGGSWSAGWALVRQSAAYSGSRPLPNPVLDVLRPYLDVAGSAGHAALWIEDRWRPAEALVVSGGLRLEAGADASGSGPARLAPRLSVRYELSPATALSAGLGRSWQYTQAASAAGPMVGAGFHREHLWIVAGDSVPALRSDVATLGIESWLGEGWLVGATAWARRSEGVLTPDPTPGSMLEGPVFVPARNPARGLELSARRLVGRLTLGLGYTYGVSSLEAAGLRFPAPADQRHVLDATAAFRSGAWRVGAAYSAASGLPYTRYSGGTFSCFPDRPCEWDAPAWRGEPGAFRAPAHQSLDVQLEWTRDFGTRRFAAYLQVRNALFGRTRGRYVGYSPEHCVQACTSEGAGGVYAGGDEFQQGLPLLPVFGVRVAF